MFNMKIRPDANEDVIFSEVVHFLLRKNNRILSNDEVIERTGISPELIYKWVKTGRLKNSLFPNLGAPCERCGRITNHAKICRHCANSITSTLAQEEKDKIWFNKIQKPTHRANAYRYK